MLTWLGESGVDSFAIKKVAGHSSIRVSQRYVHPSPEAIERAFERFHASSSEGLRERKPPTVPPGTLASKLMKGL
ncbi:MAG: hypothetical protein JOZ43_09495 [Acidobacteriales bacterium]|nr:hypothetical protein [Terriglobales bacterium]